MRTSKELEKARLNLTLKNRMQKVGIERWYRKILSVKVIFSKDFLVNDRTSVAISQCKSMEFYTSDMFTEAFDVFASTLCNLGVVYDKQTAVHKYYQAFYSHKKNRKYEKTESKFKRDAQGFLLLKLTDKTYSDQFDVYRSFTSRKDSI